MKQSPSFTKDLWLTLFLGALIALIFVRPNEAYTLTYVHGSEGDDISYFSALIRLCDFLGFSSHWASEKVLNARTVSLSHPPGVALAWFPAALLTGVLSYLIPNLNVDVSLGVGISVLNLFYLMLGFFLLLRFWDPEKRGKYWVNLSILFSLPSLFYVTQRTSSVHAFEFPLAVTTALLFRAEAIRAGVVSWVLLSVSRFQHFIFLPVYLVMKGWSHYRNRFGLLLVGAIGIVASCVAAYVALPVSNYFTRDTAVEILRNITDVKHLYYWVFPLVDLSWGLLWQATGPILIIGFSLKNWKTLSPFGRTILLWFLVDYLIIVSWRTQGSGYGFRYILAPLAASGLLIREIPNSLWQHFLKFKPLVLVSVLISLMTLYVFCTKPHLCGVPVVTPERYGYIVDYLIPKCAVEAVTDPIALVRHLGQTPVGIFLLQFSSAERALKWHFASPQMIYWVAGLSLLFVLTLGVSFLKLRGSFRQMFEE